MTIATESNVRERYARGAAALEPPPGHGAPDLGHRRAPIVHD